MSFILSPNMNLSIPTVGQEPGPQYAFDVNSSLTLIDQHDHSPGRGIKITPAGMNINVSLPFNNNPALALSYMSFTPSSLPSSVLQSLSSAPVSTINELWYTDNNGISTQITANGQVNAVAAAIPGESYAAGTFIWTQTQSALPTTPANFDIGSIILRPNTAGTTNGVTLSPPSAIASAYNISLPFLPASTSVVTISSLGVMSTNANIIPSNGGSQGQFLRQNSTGGTIWQNADSNIQVITSNYSATSVDDLIFASSAVINISLYTAVGNAGRVLSIKKTDSSLTNIITLTPNGSEKIDGLSSYTLNTLNESLTIISDGTNWSIQAHLCDIADSATALGTVTYDNLGTVTNSFITLSRVGNKLFARGSSKAGTVPSGTFAINLPAGITIDATALNAGRAYSSLGYLNQVSNGGTTFAGIVSGPFPLFYDGTINNKIYCAQQGSGSSNAFAKVNASVLTASNAGVIAWEFSIPISGWNP